MARAKWTDDPQDTQELVTKIGEATSFLATRPKRKGLFDIPQEDLVFTNGDGIEFKVVGVDYLSNREVLRFKVEPLQEGDHYIVPEIPKGQEIPHMNWILDAEVPWRLEHRHG
jgi:hypothetical protein